MTVIEVPINDLSPDPANVRTHTDGQIDKLVASLKRWGQTLPLLVDTNNVVRIGNARLDAIRRLGWATVKIVRLDLSPSEWTALAIADNRLHDESSFDRDALAAVLASLRAEDVDLAVATGFTPNDLDRLVAEMNGTGVANDPDAQWVDMPTCESEDQTAKASIKINFATLEDRGAFAKLVGQTITDNTRSLWYPPAAIGVIRDKRYAEVAGES